MKRVWHHPEEPKTGRRYWRSLGQLAKTPSAVAWEEREFPEGLAEMKDEEERETSRRTFLKLMSASTALAGLGVTACRRPELHLRPYAKAPEWVIPGKLLFYATAMPRAGGGTPLVVHTHEGRPTHLQGNKLHPDSAGGIDSLAQASILNLYDPDRARNFLRAGKKSSREEFFKFFDEKKAKLAEAQGQGLAILTDEVVSPTRVRLLTALQAKYPQAKVYRYEAFGLDNVRAAYASAFGPGVMPHYHFDKVERVFSLDCDFLGLDRVGGKSASEFFSGRKAETNEDPMNRLYVVESNYTLTGGMADHRLRVHASQTMKVAVKLANYIADKTGDPGLKAAASAVKLNGDYNAGRPEDYDHWIRLAAEDLVASKGKALVLAGSRQDPALHILVIAINSVLGAWGSVAGLHQTGVPESQTLPLSELAAAARAKQVDTLLMVGEFDPVFDAPADLKWAEVQREIPNVIVHSTRHMTATARAAAWAVPATHYLEQWGDTRGFDGTYSIVQPMILPLFGGISDIELLQALLSNEATEASEVSADQPGADMALVRETFNSLVEGASDQVWNNALRDGFVPNTKYPHVEAKIDGNAYVWLGQYVDAPPPDENRMEVTFVPCAKVWDGRYINNAWLQEAPDPISKVTWDNAALIGVRTAKALGVNPARVDEADVISVTVNGVTRYYPVMVIPGHADNAVTLAGGYGQRGTGEEGPGRVGQGTGFDVYGLRTSKTAYIATGAVVKRATEKVTTGLDWTDREEIPPVYPVGTTAEHHSMYGRALVREGTLDDWKANPDFVLDQGMEGHLHGDRATKQNENNFSFYKPVGRKLEDGTREPLLNDDLHQWGMVIDLNRCIGCNSCLVACQSENNIPVVGKDQVRRGREMHWIRMDRYFATDLDSDAALNNRRVESNPFNREDNVWNEDEMDDPSMLVEPVACQHCESAPCETVCPVNATVHSPDGLNVMVYNRCIGTRYCANNCPFKVRRFNFFDYNKRNPLAEKSVAGFKFNNLYAGPFGERQDTELSKLQKNPNVSVRMRGVIEKCTYCVQRIESARIDARATARKRLSLESGQTDERLTFDKKELRIPTNGVRTACQEACPSGAITFGNLLDENSDVVKAKKNSRNYDLLGYLAVRARTSYLGRVKNPNPELLKVSVKERRKVGQGSKSHGEFRSILKNTGRGDVGHVTH